MTIDETGRRFFLASLIASSSLLPLTGQPATHPSAGKPYVPKQSDRPEPLAGDEPGFKSIFDGNTLSGWDGDPKYWRVSDGCMVGEITPETIIKSNTFIIWRGGEPADFELKVEYRITPGGNIPIGSCFASRTVASNLKSKFFWARKNGSRLAQLFPFQQEIAVRHPKVSD